MSEMTKNDCVWHERFKILEAKCTWQYEMLLWAREYLIDEQYHGDEDANRWLADLEKGPTDE